MIPVIVDNRTTTSNSWLNYIDFLHLCPAYLLAASPATTNGSVRPLPSPLLSFPSLSTFQDVLQRRTFGRQQNCCYHCYNYNCKNCTFFSNNHKTRTLSTNSIFPSLEDVLVGRDSGPLRMVLQLRLRLLKLQKVLLEDVIVGRPTTTLADCARFRHL